MGFATTNNLWDLISSLGTDCLGTLHTTLFAHNTQLTLIPSIPCNNNHNTIHNIHKHFYLYPTV